LSLGINPENSFEVNNYADDEMSEAAMESLSVPDSQDDE